MTTSYTVMLIFKGECVRLWIQEVFFSKVGYYVIVHDYDAESNYKIASIITDSKVVTSSGQLDAKSSNHISRILHLVDFDNLCFFNNFSSASSSANNSSLILCNSINLSRCSLSISTLISES